MQVIPNGNTFSVSTQGGDTFIAALNPRVNGIFVAHVAESSPRKNFTVTDLLDGTIADEYLRYDCDHAVLNYFWGQYSGAIVKLTNENGSRFQLVKMLSHAECVEFHMDKVGVTVDAWNYAGMCNVAKREELRRAKMIATQEATIYKETP